MRARLVAIAVATSLLVVAAVLPGLRRRFIADLITWDAPSEPARLPATGTAGPGLDATSRVRVVLIDGLGASTAQTLRTWSGLCARGLRLTVDVGFPTVSLPVEVALWSGLTQQQTGVVFRSDRPLVPPLDRRGIPARVPDSVAVAEHHGWIARSLGFATTLPLAGDAPVLDREPAVWATQWEDRAREAVASAARLVFVHILRVDTAGHRRGSASAEYALAAGESDAILAQLYVAAPDARWFLLSDHAHLPGGGHGGEDLSVRQVEGCLVGPGIAAGTGGPVHIVDVSRALADSLGLPLDRRSLARPISVALAHPLGGDAAIPPLATGALIVAVVMLLVGLAATAWGVRRWWLAPWWFVLACALLAIVRGVPTMWSPMTYARESLADLFDLDRRLMMRAYLAALPLVAVSVWLGISRVGLARALLAQLALPVAALAAALTLCHAWGPLLGAERAPVAPTFTALASALMLITAQGLGVAALAALARTVLAASGPRRRTETPRSEP